ncbi:MAG: type II secretion protein F [bacterium]|nr:type II secretion protein F [bacterium]
MSSLIGALLGAAGGCGIFTTVLGWRGLLTPPSGRPWKAIGGQQRPAASYLFRLAIAVAGSFTAFLLTGWLVAGLIAGVAGYISPTVLRAKAIREQEINRMIALATWVEMIRDTCGAASGVTETLKATAETAPTSIRTPVRQLAIRAEREPLPNALAKFADEIDHAVADTVAITLGMAAADQVGSLQESLAELAENTRREVSMRLRIEASRVRQFTSARFIAVVVAVFSVGMISFNRSYTAAFDTLSGQVALAVIGGLFLGSAFALVRMSRFSNPPRILEVHQHPPALSMVKGLSE